MNKKSILVFRTGQLGDALVALPAVEEIRRRYPEHSLSLLTDVGTSNGSEVTSWDVFGPVGLFDNVIQYQPAAGTVKKLMTFWRMRRKIRRMSPEIMYDLVFPRTDALRQRDRVIFRYVMGIPRYEGYADNQKPAERGDGSLPRVMPEWKRLLKVVGVKEQQATYRLPIPHNAQDYAEKFLRERGIGGGWLIGLGPGANIPAKKWAEERFLGLAERILRENLKAEILVLGGKADAGIGERLFRRAGHRVHNLAGELSVYESGAVLKKCRAYVGNDTGTMHLAALVGTPCIALFSARDYPGLWEPYGTGHTVIRKEIACAGCMLKKCDIHKNRCMDLITVDEVFNALEKIPVASLTHC